MLLNVWELNLRCCSFLDRLLCLKFGTPTNMAGRLARQERAQLAACYEVWRSVVQEQR